MADRCGRLLGIVTLAALLTVHAVSRGQAGREWLVAAGGSGSGSRQAPFGQMSEALASAQPGDIVTVMPGVYRQRIDSIRDGLPSAPILVRALEPGSAVFMSRGRVLTVGHAYHVFEGLGFDGEYGSDDIVRVTSAGDFLVLRNVEVRRSGRDLVDLAGPEGVTIERSRLHHALNASGGRTDAHAVVAGPVRDLAILDSEIHTFSGDGLQLDPGRQAPGWSARIERTRIWLAPLSEAVADFAAGVVPGENAVDTKTVRGAGRSSLVVRDVVASGFRGGLIGNMAAFNLKENVDVLVDRVTVFDSEIALRLRGPVTRSEPGARITVQNAVVYDVDTAFRYEDDIEGLRIRNSTIGLGVGRAFRAAGARMPPELRNVLMLGALPSWASHSSNLSVGPGTFAGAAGHDYRLAPGASAIDAGIAIDGVTHDRAGTSRPIGKAVDVGAFEYTGDGRASGGSR